jgi:hypothetical protein
VLKVSLMVAKANYPPPRKWLATNSEPLHRNKSIVCGSANSRRTMLSDLKAPFNAAFAGSSALSGSTVITTRPGVSSSGVAAKHTTGKSGLSVLDMRLVTLLGANVALPLWS